MKRLLLFTVALFAAATTLLSQSRPDSVFLFAYSSPASDYQHGLQFAQSDDGKQWTAIGNNHAFLRSDYGRWGLEKRMYQPYLLLGADQVWRVAWQLNQREPLFAYAESRDLITWGRQQYPFFEQVGTCQQPAIYYNAGRYDIVFRNSKGEQFLTSTSNGKTFSAAKNTQVANTARVKIRLGDQTLEGQILKVSSGTASRLVLAADQAAAKWQTEQATFKDSISAPLTATLTRNKQPVKTISDKLIGVFFEDINYAADGGLYAEMIQNRDFEYRLSDREHRDSNWNPLYAWSSMGSQARLSIDSVNPIHPNNPHYAVLQNKGGKATLLNKGYDGISVSAGETYRFSFRYRYNGKAQPIYINIVSPEGKILASASEPVKPGGWATRELSLHARAGGSKATLNIGFNQPGTLAVDMVSLFPVNTYKKRANGLRKDLAETIAAMHPQFVRFPGGCLAHGDGLHNMYRWKNSIGPLEARLPQRNIWGYHQTMGLGYFEYFQFCEDIGATALPVVPAGVPCQNSGPGPRGGGQQGGIPLADMPAYIQEILDLIEWANGDASTTWGSQRAAAGHPAPFQLKYIGIGNEDLISDVFEERFTLIYEAVKAKHPEITVIGTVGPSAEGTDYEQGWALAEKLQLPMVDEHYYRSPGWFVQNQTYYDHYPRNRAKVYLGEYASHAPGAKTNLLTALTEALYLTAVERNGDVVQMASYAPLLARKGRTQWNPDLIYFDNDSIRTTISYEVQQLFGNNSGTNYQPTTLQVNSDHKNLQQRVAASIVVDPKSGDTIIKMVNLLPVDVSLQTDFTGAATRYTLQGQPGDEMGKYQTSIEKSVSCLDLPAWSFTVLRLSK